MLEEKRLASAIQIAGRYTRSVNLLRDLSDPRALEGYVVTRSSREALLQIGLGLRNGSSQRAWKVIGPYGTGKSSLALFIASLVSKASFSVAAKILPRRDEQLLKCFKPVLNLTPLVVVGEQSSLTKAVLKALVAKAAEFPGRHPPAIGEARAALQSSSELELAAFLMPTLTAICELAVKSGHAGVLLLVDEIGKFIEYASLTASSGELYSLQQLAEAAGGASKVPFSIVTLQHQQFEGYASERVGDSANEWGKVSARFEDIVFDEPIEQCAGLLAATIHGDAKQLEAHGISNAAQELYAAYFSDRQPAVVKPLVDAAPSLFPVHPATLQALAQISKRLGQSERSIFAFLQGHTPFGLRQHLEREPLAAGSWYRLHHFYEYLERGGGLRFRSLEVQRKWEFVRTKLETLGSLTDGQLRLARTVAIEDCFGPFRRGSTTPESLAQSIGVTTSQIMSDLEALRGFGVLMQRTSSDDVALCTSQAINAEGLFEEASRSGTKQDRIIVGMQQTILRRRLTATRHYHRTGTLRTLTTKVVFFEDAPNWQPSRADEGDGVLLLVLCTGAEFARWPQVQVQQNATQSPIVVSRYVLAPPDVMSGLDNIARWKIVRKTVNAKVADAWALNYIDRELDGAQRLVEAALGHALGGASPTITSPWIHCGKIIEGGSEWHANEVASWLFDRLYVECPPVRNELINRGKLPSAISLARQRLFEGALSAPSADLFSIEGFPPERLIYWTLFRESGLHRPLADGNFELAPPSQPPAAWRPFWDAVSNALRGSSPVSLSQLVNQLRAPPFGVRESVSATLIAGYIVACGSNVALFERGTFVPIITSEHLVRLFRSPQTFSARVMRPDGAQTRLLASYNSVCSALGVELPAPCNAADIAAAIIRWFMRLPDFARQTRNVSPQAQAVRDIIAKARDPVQLVIDDLPALVLDRSDEQRVAELKESFLELARAERTLRETICVSLASAFSVSGDLTTVREHLSKEAGAYTSELTEFRLRSFIVRACDPTLTDDRWLSSIASLLTGRPIESWDDNTISVFSSQCNALASSFKTWVLLMARRSATASKSKYVAVTVVNGSGEEVSSVVAETALAKQSAHQLLNRLREEHGEDESAIIPILTLALSQLKSKEEEASHARTGAI